MASTYSDRIKIEKITTGEKSGEWGTITNENFDRIDIAINGIASVALTSSEQTSGTAKSLALGTSTVDEDGRHQFIEFTAGSPTPTGTLYAQLQLNNAEKVCFVRNSTAQTVILFQGTYSASNDLELAAGKDAVVKFDGGGSGAIVELALKDPSFATVTTSGDVTVGGDLTISGDDITMATNTSGHMLIADGTNYNPVAMSGDATISSSGALTIANNAIENAMLADDAVDTAEIADDAVTSAQIANNAVALGTQTTGNYIQSITAGTHMTFTGSANAESATPSIAVDAVSANTASKIVARDSSGNFSAGTVTAALSGNATTATTLATARTIGGVSFDGSANINLPGVNASGTQDTTGNAGTATALETARTIGGVSFDGSANINLPGVNTAGTQDTSGTADVAKKLLTGSGGWTVEAVGTDLHFKYNGTVVISFESNGKGVFKDDLVAFDSTP